MSDDCSCRGAPSAGAGALIRLPVISSDVSHDGGPLNLTDLHAEISRWFDEHPDRQYHLVAPNGDYHEEACFDVGGRGDEGYREMSAYGFVPCILYVRTPPCGDLPACIFKKHLFIHATLSLSDDDMGLEHVSRFDSDQYVYFPLPRCIEQDLFWERHERDPDGLFKFLWAQAR